MAIAPSDVSIERFYESSSGAELQPRQGLAEALDDIFTAGLLGASSGAMKTVFGPPPPSCCDNADSARCFNAGKNDAGHKWMACYTPGHEQIYDFDVEAMKCIINLHYTQDDACIDVAGSMCSKGYGGGLMMSHMGFLGGNIKADQLSAQDSATFQAAAESMLNVKIKYSGTTGQMGAIDLVLPNDRGDLLMIEIYFDGHKGKDC